MITITMAALSEYSHESTERPSFYLFLPGARSTCQQLSSRGVLHWAIIFMYQQYVSTIFIFFHWERIVCHLRKHIYRLNHDKDHRQMNNDRLVNVCLGDDRGSGHPQYNNTELKSNLPIYNLDNS